MFLGVGCPGNGVAKQVENSNESKVVPFQLSPMDENDFLFLRFTMFCKLNKVGPLSSYWEKMSRSCGVEKIHRIRGYAHLPNISPKSIFLDLRMLLLIIFQRYGMPVQVEKLLYTVQL